jgi:hypothetical protein
MANDVTNGRLWILDTTGVIAAVGTFVKVRKLVYFPAAVDNAVTIQEYIADATLKSAIVMKADPAVARPFEMDFGPECRQLDGFKLSAISAGSLYVYIGRG